MAFSVGDRVRYAGTFLKKKLGRKVGTVNSRVNNKNLVVAFTTTCKSGEEIQNFVIGEVLLIPSGE